MCFSLIYPSLLSSLHHLHALYAVADQLALVRLEIHANLVHSVEREPLYEITHAKRLVSDDFEHRRVASKGRVQELRQNFGFHVVDHVGADVDVGGLTCLAKALANYTEKLVFDAVVSAFGEEIGDFFPATSVHLLQFKESFVLLLCPLFFGKVRIKVVKPAGYGTAHDIALESFRSRSSSF